MASFDAPLAFPPSAPVVWLSPFFYLPAEVEAAKSDAERAQATDAASAANQKRGLKAMPMSDAILNCAACMCILSLDCQKYDFCHLPLY